MTMTLSVGHMKPSPETLPGSLLGRGGGVVVLDADIPALGSAAVNMASKLPASAYPYCMPLRMKKPLKGHLLW